MLLFYNKTLPEESVTVKLFPDIARLLGIEMVDLLDIYRALSLWIV